MLNRISKKTGLTKTEIKILLFIIVSFVTGFVYKTFFNSPGEIPYREFDYSGEDKKFYATEIDSAGTDSIMDINKKPDYKDEVLNFSSKDFKQFKKKTEPALNSINLNTAGYSELMNLPGVGSKTANAIIELRKKLKKFSDIDQLLDVKGIGKNKLNKIKKYVYIN